MSKNVLGLDLDTSRVGCADTRLFTGQINFAKNVRSEHPGAYLKELHGKLSMILRKGHFDAVAYESAEYGLNANSFVDADRRARMIGVVMLAASQRGISTIEVPPRDVCAMATGKKQATKSDFLSSALGNGVKLKSEFVAHAYWVMCVALKRMVS